MRPDPISEVAQLVQHPRDVTDRKNAIAYGLCVHTTGSGVPSKAKKLGVTPLEVALSVYLALDKPPVFTSFPHYVIDSEGATVQIAGDNERARHCGIDPDERKLYLSGQWKNKVSPSVLSLWKSRWASYSSPLMLFPSLSPNEDYLGCELIPALKPYNNGSLFSDEQYSALVSLMHDIQARHSISLRGARLVGHEDIEPLTRWTKTAGWDPGGLSLKPTFFWSEIYSRL